MDAKGARHMRGRNNSYGPALSVAVRSGFSEGSEKEGPNHRALNLRHNCSEFLIITIGNGRGGFLAININISFLRFKTKYPIATPTH